MNAIPHSHHSAAIGINISRVADQFIGVWTLVSYTDERPDSEDIFPFGPRPQGFLIYTADGFVSAQLMRPDRSAFHSSNWNHGTLEEYRESGSGYIAYCGTYEVDEDNAMITHTPSVALLPNLIGGRQSRLFELNGDRLTLLATGVPVVNGPSVTSRLEWKRAT